MPLQFTYLETSFEYHFLCKYSSLLPSSRFKKYMYDFCFYKNVKGAHSHCAFSPILFHGQMARPPGPLLFKIRRVWGWFISNNFQGPHFLFTGELIWLIYMSVICSWNKFGEKVQCATVMQVNSKLVSLDTALSSLSKTQDKEVIKWKQILQHNKYSMVMKLLILKRNFFFFNFQFDMMASQ